MNAELPRNICGRPVRDASFYDRVEEQRIAWERLETDHLLLAAPRRVGKTSLLYRLVRDARRKGWLAAVYTTAASAADERAFVARLYAEIARAPECTHIADRLAKGRYSAAVKRVSSLSVASVTVALQEHATEDWTALAADLQDALLTLPPGRKLLVMVDELPILLLKLLALDRARATAFLDWFRELRQGSPERSDDVRWMVAGSIGLGPLARRERWSALVNDLLPLELGAFAEPVAHTFLADVGRAHGLTIDESARTAILAEVGWHIPFYLHLYVSGLRDRQLSHPTAGDIAAVGESLLGHEASKHFAPWWERLEDELGATDAAAARAMLARCAADPQGASLDTLTDALAGFFGDTERDERRRWLLEVLEGDGYLLGVEGRWRFRSPLLRRAWLARSAR